MSRSRLQRTLCILAATFVLALPVAAQPREEGRTATLMQRLISALWERLAPLASLSKGSTTPVAPADSTISTTSDDDTTEGRAHIDPNG